jgi:hypothetical protein
MAKSIYLSVRIKNKKKKKNGTTRSREAMKETEAEKKKWGIKPGS